MFALYTRWFHRWALLIGWAVGMGYGTYLAYTVPLPGKPGTHFGGPLALVPFTETKGYIALDRVRGQHHRRGRPHYVFRAMNITNGTDETDPSDYHADAGDEGVEDVLEGEPGTAPATG